MSSSFSPLLFTKRPKDTPSAHSTFQGRKKLPGSSEVSVVLVSK